MATTYYAPGVYIEEVDKGTKPIQGVATSVTAFIGFTQKAEKPEPDGLTTRSILGQPTLITNWGQYEKHFGSFHKDAFLPYAVRGFFDNGGTRCYVTSVLAMQAHRAQVVVDVADPKELDAKKRKPIPGLMLIAKEGGLHGNSLEVEITAETQADPKAKSRFTMKISGVPATQLSKVLNVEKQPIQQTIDALQTQIQDLQTQNDTTKAEWAAKDIDLDAIGQKWKHQKENYTGPDKDKLDKIQQDWLVQRTSITTKQDEVKALQKELSDLGKNGAGAVPPFNFAMDELPLWGARDQKSQQELADSQGDFVQVWRLHKQGPEAAFTPAIDLQTKELSTKLDLGTMLFDHAFLVKNRLVSQNEIDQADSTEKQLTFFADKSKLLYQGEEAARRGIDGHFAFDDINLVCAPDLMKVYEILGKEKKADADTIVQGVQESILTFCKRAHYPFAILDTPPDKGVQEIADWRMGMPGGDTMHGALYYPWIKITDPFDAKRKIAVPPCGHIAGIYARSDNERGIHKAPANEPVNGAIDLALNVTKSEQELLNPMGVNCIRQFPGRGIRVWGARTLAMTDPSWRYINVRRLFSYVEASVERSTQWIVFEPNDHILWAKVRRDVTAFLRTVWLSGALFGVTPEKAFYVKCDEETNLPELRDLGQMVCEIGMAPVKPAEFVLFRFSQWAAESDV